MNVPVAGGGVLNVQKHPDCDVLVIVMWTSYNPLCAPQLSAVSAALDRYEKHRVQLFAVNIGEDIATVQAYQEEHDLEMMFGLDLKHELRHALNVNQLPFLVIIDDKGVVRSTELGYSDSKQFRLKKEIAEVLAEIPK